MNLEEMVAANYHPDQTFSGVDMAQPGADKTVKHLILSEGLTERLVIFLQRVRSQGCSIDNFRCTACEAVSLLNLIGDLEMSDENTNEAPIVEAGAAIVNSLANPTPANILADIELALRLVQELKDKLSGAHPSIWDLLKALL